VSCPCCVTSKETITNKVFPNFSCIQLCLIQTIDTRIFKPSLRCANCINYSTIFSYSTLIRGELIQSWSIHIYFEIMCTISVIFKWMITSFFLFKEWPYPIQEDSLSLVYWPMLILINIYEISQTFFIGLQVTWNESDYQPQSNMHPKINTKHNWQIFMNIINIVKIEYI